MYLSALIYYADCNFSLGQICLDLSSGLPGLTSAQVTLVSRTTIHVASPQGCTPGLAGLEPSGVFIHRDSAYIVARTHYARLVQGVKALVAKARSLPHTPSQA